MNPLFEKALIHKLQLRHNVSKERIAEELRSMKQRIEWALQALERGEEVEETLVQNMMGLTGTIVQYNTARDLLPYFEQPAADAADKTKKE
jgi:hypothetical protein